jgi:tetratricopeptide (TPR) repeat protein
LSTKFANFKIVVLVSLILLVLTQQATAVESETANRLKKAQTLLDADRAGVALTILNGLIVKDPANAKVISERSRAYWKTGRLDKALQDANKAVALAPNLAVVHVNRAAAYFFEKKYEMALEDSVRAIELDSRCARAYTLKAFVDEALERYRQQINDCDKAIALEPKLPDNYVLRSNAYEYLKQYKLALRDRNKALSLSLKDPLPNHITRAKIYVGLGQLNTAAGELTVAIKVDPRSVLAYSLRADAFERLGQFQKEIDDLSAAIKISSCDVDFYEQRAVVYYTLGQLQKTLEESKKIETLKSGSLVAAWCEAQVFEELGQYDEAIKACTIQLRSKGATAFDWSVRANLYELIGRHDLALADWRVVGRLANSSDRLLVQLHFPFVDLSNLSAESYKKKIDAQQNGKDVILPFKYDAGGHIFVPADLNGHALKLLIDTGCADTQVSRAAMNRLAQKSDAQLHDKKADGKDRVFGCFKARELILDNLDLCNVQIGVYDEVVRDETSSGFLGGNVLGNFVVTIDYLNKKVILADSFKQDISKNSIIVPMIVRNDCPYCMVRIDGKLERLALLDTGAPFSNSADALIASILPKKFEFTEQMTGPWLGDLRSRIFQLRRIELGKFICDEQVFDVFPAFEAPSAASEIILGNDFLSRFKSVTFDNPGRRLILEPREDGSQSALNLYNEGNFSLTHGDYQSGMEALSKTIALEPELAANCYLYRGEAYFNLQEYQKAIDDFDERIRLGPENKKVLSERAWTHVILGHHQKAIEDFDKLAPLEPNECRTFYMRAIEYGKLGRYEKQIEYDTRALQMHPLSFVYEDRALAYDALGKHRLADADREKAKRLDRYYK